MSIDVRLLGPDDSSLVMHAARGVFDNEPDPALTAEFLADQRHHLAAAIDGDLLVGIASAVHYVHPDKPPQLFINEVAVAPSHHNQGIAKRLLGLLIELGERLHCTELWVLTDRGNTIACRLYESVGAEAPGEECVMYTIRLPS
jgi:ribosomal protein S18 acetylase RimI-like enzyme